MKTRLSLNIVCALSLVLGSSIETMAQNTVWAPTPLELTVDARSAGLGSKLAADLDRDGYVATYNPAEIDSTAKGTVYLSYLNYYAGIQVGAINAVLKCTPNLTIYSGARFASYGEFSGFDASGWPTSDFSGGDYFAQTGFTFSLDSSLSAGVTMFGGFRNLAMENAGVLGLDAAIMKRWDEKHLAVGVLASSFGRQFTGTGSQPVGWMPMNLQVGMTKGFNHAPFQLFLNLQHLENWALAPEGTYDNLVDPLTGEIIENSTWVFGDQLIRHVNLGVELSFGDNFSAQIGYEHRRRKEMIAAGMQGTNGLSIGLGMNFKDLNVRLARNTYHFAGSSTHLSIGINLPG